MTAKEMFEALGYEQTKNNDYVVEYIDYSHGDSDYKYVIFWHMWKKYEVGYYEGYKTRTDIASSVTIKEHEAITKMLEELGWS